LRPRTRRPQLKRNPLGSAPITTLRASPTRVVSRRAVAACLEGVLAATPWLLGYYWRYQMGIPMYTPWIQTGVVFGVLTVLVRFFFKKRSIPEIAADRDGLTYLYRGTTVRIPWSEYRGHRLTWTIPRQLRVLGAPDESMVIDLSLFDDDQRETFMRELSMHPEVALPNQRLKLTPRGTLRK